MKGADNDKKGSFIITNDAGGGGGGGGLLPGIFIGMQKKER